MIIFYAAMAIMIIKYNLQIDIFSYISMIIKYYYENVLVIF